jgi:hypothetical protein
MFSVKVRKYKGKHSCAILPYLMVTALALLLSACSLWPQSASPMPASSPASTNLQQSNTLPIVALPGYQVSLLASNIPSYSHPDSVDVDGTHVFIGYQNDTAVDGSDHKSSTIVEYTMNGQMVRTFSVLGHCDGLRVDPSTHLLWVVSNEAGNPTMATIDPTSGTVTPYTFPPAPHKGGYDDLYFLNGMAFITASYPQLDQSGNNVFPAIDSITLSDGEAVLRPVLMGNATATDTITNTTVTLNEANPDSLSTDSNGDLVMVNGSEIVYVHDPATPQQKVTRTQVGTQIDDTVWITSAHGRLLVVDRANGKTYWIRTTFDVGTVYTETVFNAGVSALVGRLDTGTGNIAPIAIGFTDPSGLLFVPDK